MDDPISEIIQKRSIPGFLIIDPGYNLLYANKEALEIIFGTAKWRSPLGGTLFHGSVPEEIVTLCDQLKTDRSRDGVPEDAVFSSEMIDAATGGCCSLRVFHIAKAADDDEMQHIMVLMERIIENHEVDFAQAKEAYGLSKREVEVLQCVCRGLTNKEIAERKFISEYTVKDHVKKIMRNMSVNSRSEIFAVLLNWDK